MLEITEDNFAETTLGSPVPVLVDFTAEWCPPCRQLAPHLEAVAERYRDRARVGRCDADTQTALAARYGIRGLPTLLLFHGGRVVGQLTGAVPRARIEALLDRALET